MAYTPKINPAAVYLGYTGSDPKTLAAASGYLNTNPSKLPQQARKTN